VAESVRLQTEPSRSGHGQNETRKAPHTYRGVGVMTRVTVTERTVSLGIQAVGYKPLGERLAQWLMLVALPVHAPQCPVALT